MTRPKAVSLILAMFVSVMAIVGQNDVVLAHGVIDQESVPPGGTGMIFTHRGPPGLQFVPTVSSVSGVDMQLGSFFPTTLSVTVSIIKGAYGGPVVGSEVHSITVTGSTSGTGEIVHIDFVTPMPVTPGDTYVLSLFVDTSDGVLEWFISGDEPYPDGNGTKPAEVFSGLDFTFATYVLEQNKSDILKGSGIDAPGIDKAPGLDKKFNEKGKGADKAGKKK